MERQTSSLRKPKSGRRGRGRGRGHGREGFSKFNEKSFAFIHIIIKSKEKIEINSLCENENCSDKEILIFIAKIA